MTGMRKLSCLFAAMLIISACGSGASSTTTAGTSSTTTAEVTTTAAPVTTADVATTAASSGPIEATDARDVTIELTEPADSVVCLYGASCWGLLADLGITPVGSTSGTTDMAAAAYWGDSATDIPVVQWDSVEEVAGVEPDLIIAREGNDDLAEAMEVVAPVYLTSSNGWQGSVESTREVAALTNRVAEGEAAIERFEQRIQELVDAVGPVTDPPSIGIQAAFLESGYYMLWDNSGVCSLLEEKGMAVCPFPATAQLQDTGTTYEGEFSAEYVLQQNPQMIAMLGWPGAPRFEDRADPVWGQLAAVQDGKVFQDDVSYSLYGQSLRSLEFAFQRILSVLYPDKVEDPGPWETWVPAGA